MQRLTARVAGPVFAKEMVEIARRRRYFINRVLYGLALLSTLSGNLLLFGSFANLMVVERAATFGVRLSFAEHAKVGIPVTLLSIAFAVFWLAYLDWLPWTPESW